MTPNTQHRIQASAIHLLKLLLFALAYIACAEIGHFLSFQNSFASFWPPNGLYLAVLLRTRQNRWWQIILAALLANATSDIFLRDQSPIVSFLFGFANTLEATIGAIVFEHLRSHFHHTQQPTILEFSLVKHVLFFGITIAAISVPIGATIGASVASYEFGQSFSDAWLTWWSADVIGTLVVAPTILAWSNKNHIYTFIRYPKRWPEAFLFSVGFIFLTHYIFSNQPFPLAWVTPPLLLWAAFRFGFRSTTSLIVIMTLLVIWNTSQGHGPFGHVTPLRVRILILQSYITITTFSYLLVIALVQERYQAIDLLKQEQVKLKDYQEQLHKLATTDELTGLNNRRAFNTMLETGVTQAHHAQQPLSLVLLDVDLFKQFNDMFGHPAGDQVLQQVAHILRKQTHIQNCLARYGGEEFAIIASNTTRQDAYLLAEHIRSHIQDYSWSHRPITVSIGIATLTSDISDATSLLQNADKALYASKSQGRNTVRHHEALETNMSVRDGSVWTPLAQLESGQ